MNNNITLIGMITKPTLSFSNAGLAIFKATLAGKDGKTTFFHQVTFFGSQAEKYGEAVKEGDFALVQGKLHTSSREVDGVKKTTLEIQGDKLELLEGDFEVTQGDKSKWMTHGRNHVQVIGNLGQDPKSGTTTTTGEGWASNSVAVTDSWQKDGQWVEKTHWVNLSAWREAAASLGGLIKGTSVIIEGVLVTEKPFTDQSGVLQYPSPKLEITSIYPLAKKAKAAAPQEKELAAVGGSSKKGKAKPTESEEELNQLPPEGDDLPF